MALGATIHRVELELADIDRGVYGSHALTLARHPSETTERLMLRLLAWAMHADERLAFGRGISSEEDPDLWLRADDGTIPLWMEVGLPEERRLRKAASRAESVKVIAYGGRGVGVWRERLADAFARIAALQVTEITAEESRGLEALCSRNMKLHCTIQDGQIVIGDDTRSLIVTPRQLWPH
jgi:uncharacterized protein YaeQ